MTRDADKDPVDAEDRVAEPSQQSTPEDAGGAGDQELVLTNYTIEPGEEVVWEVVWDGSRDGQGGKPYVDPGSYFIRGSFNALDADWATTEHDTVTIEPQEDGDG